AATVCRAAPRYRRGRRGFRRQGGRAPYPARGRLPSGRGYSYPSAYVSFPSPRMHRHTGMTALPLLDLSGDAHQRGHRHGSFARDMIAANIRTYLRRFTFTGASEARIMEEGARWA